MIHVSHLSKEFKKTIKDPGLKGSIKSLFAPKHKIITAVNDVSFDVAKGEILGFIGPNGAGKSTCIKMLTGILTPTSGQCEINGLIPQKNRVKYVKDIGVVFGQRTQLWWDLPLTESFSVLKEIYDVPDTVYKQRLEMFYEVLGIKDFMGSPVRTLSLGQRMRADIAAAMLHKPKVLFLDEPTIGLDVVVKDSIRQMISTINKEEGTTVILTTHDLNDIELLCKRIVLIDKGSLIYDGTIDNIKHKYGKMKEIVFSAKDNNFSSLDYSGKFGTDSDSLTAEIDNGQMSVTFDSGAFDVQDILSYSMKNCSISDIVIKDTDIEEIIRKIYKSELSVSMDGDADV